MTSTHKVTAYFTDRTAPVITYYGSKGEAVIGANEAKKAGAYKVIIQMV